MDATKSLIIVILIILVIGIILIVSTTKPVSNKTTTSLTTSIITRNVSSTISPSSTSSIQPNLYSPHIKNYNFISDVALLQDDAQVPVKTGFMSGHFLTYSSPNSSLVIRTLTYASSSEAKAAYNYIINYTGLNFRYIYNVSKNFSIIETNTSNTDIYSGSSILGNSVFTVSVVQNTGQSLSESFAVNSIIQAMNKTMSEYAS